ncbi:MAG: AsmA family protein, partial [Arenicellales bacterium]
DQPIEIKADGSLEGVQTNIVGSLGTLRTLFTRSPSVADLNATMATSGRISAQGTVQDVLAWSGIDVVLKASIDRLRYLSALFPKQPLDASNIEAGARLYQPETARSMKLQGIEGDFSLWGIDMNLSGKVEKLSRLEQIELHVGADSNFDIQKINQNWSFAAPLNAHIDAILRGESDYLTLDLAVASVNTDSMTLSATGDIRDLTGTWQQALPIELELNDLSALGQVMGKLWPAAGLITGKANLQRTDSGFSLEDVSVSNQEAPISLQAEGYLRHIGQDQKGRLTIAGKASSQFFEENQAMLPSSPFIPDPETFEIEAEILIDGQDGKMIIVAAETTGPGYFAQGSGEIPNLQNPGGLVISFDGEVTDEVEVGEALDVYLPNIGPVAFSAKLVGEGEGIWNLIDIIAKTTTDAGKLHVEGSINRIGPGTQAELPFALETRSSELIASLPGMDALKPLQEEFSAISVTGNLSSQSRSSWSIDQLQAQTSWNDAKVTISGDIDRLQPIEGLLEVHIVGEPDRLPTIAQQYNFPQVDEINVKFSVVLPLENRIHDIDARLSRSGSELKVKGAMLELVPLKGDNISVQLQADDLAELMPFEHTIAPENELNVDLVLTINPDGLAATGTVVAGESLVNGSVVWADTEEGRPLLNVDANVERLDLKTLFVVEKKQGRVFSNDSLFPQWMQKIDGKIDLEIKSFRNNVIAMKDLTATIRFDHGDLRLDFASVTGESVIKGLARIHPIGQSEIQLKAKEVPVQSIQSLAEGHQYLGGTFDVDISLRGLGSSLGELVKTGNGVIKLEISGSRIQSNALDAVGGDLFTNVLTVVNPYSDRDDFVEVECGVIHFDLHNGMATTRNGLALKTDRVTVLGGGEISFPDEKVKLVIAPKPRKGFGISPSTIAKMIRVGGTLSDPEIESDVKGFLQSGAAIGAAIFSGGISLVAQGLMDRLQANSAVCEIARGAIDFDQDKVVDEAKTR